jgi:ferredoxin-NADP reductase
MTSLPQHTTSQTHWMKHIKEEFSRAIVNNAHLGSYIEPMVQSFQPHWTLSGYRARLVKRQDENKHVFTITLKPSKNWPGFCAGQFIEIYTEQNGQRLTRCFSISSSPCSFAKHGTIELTIRIQENGRVTPALHQDLKAGQFIGISEAKGDFILSEKPSPLLLVAGGSGITPFRSILQEMSHQQKAPNTTLLYYAQDQDSHLFKQELEQLASQHSNINIVCISTKVAGRFRIGHLLQHCADYTSCNIYICGPTGMIQSVNKILLDTGMNDAQIHFEYFGAAPIEGVNTDTEGRVLFSKSTKSVASLPGQPESILTLAEQSGVNPKSGCKMGLCGQCQCTKTSGVVFNTKTGLTSDTGKESIKLCISVPVGDVTIDL